MRRSRHCRDSRESSISAMFSQMDPVDLKGCVAALKKRVMPLFVRAKEKNVFLNVDLEQWAYHDITYALFEEIVYDENGTNLTGTFADYLLPTAVETPKWELGKTITPSPHHPIGAKGVGESPTVGAPPAIANAVVDALWHLGVRHIDIPITPQKVWKLLREKGVTD